MRTDIWEILILLLTTCIMHLVFFLLTPSKIPMSEWPQWGVWGYCGLCYQTHSRTPSTICLQSHTTQVVVPLYVEIWYPALEILIIEIPKYGIVEQFLWKWGGFLKINFTPPEGASRFILAHVLYKSLRYRAGQSIYGL